MFFSFHFEATPIAASMRFARTREQAALSKRAKGPSRNGCPTLGAGSRSVLKAARARAEQRILWEAARA